MKTDDKFKNIKTRSLESLVDQLLSTVERHGFDKTNDALRKQLLEASVLAYEIKLRVSGKN